MSKEKYFDMKKFKTLYVGKNLNFAIKERNFGKTFALNKRDYEQRALW